eukprot:scaffold4658_cov118-Cylindrotheca_fusiformis.AAC.20
MSTLEARLARLEAAAASTIPVTQMGISNDEKLNQISDLVASLEQNVKGNQESIVSICGKLDEISSCLRQMTKVHAAQLVEAKAAHKQREAQLVEAKVANTHRKAQLIAAALLKAGPRAMLISGHNVQQMLNSLQRGEYAEVSNILEQQAEIIKAIHGLTGIKPLTKKVGSDCVLYYPD